MQTKKRLIQKARKTAFFLLALSPSICLAAGNNQLVSIFDSAATFLTSTLARGAGVTAIAAVGYLYLFQNRIDKARAISIIASIGIILGAGAIYDLLAA